MRKHETLTPARQASEATAGRSSGAGRGAGLAPPPYGIAFADSAATVQRQPAAENRTGLPDGLKAGIESLSGIDMSDVRVHASSSKPAQLSALAYAQGTDIHLAPGQEKHLPHEAWHVVQQKQGRVRPTMQLKEGVPINDNTGLEREADVMGARAVQMRRPDQNTTGPAAQVLMEGQRGVEAMEASEIPTAHGGGGTQVKQHILQKCIGREGHTYSSFDQNIQLDNGGGALTVYKINTGGFDHRLVALEWYDGLYEHHGKELSVHLVTPELTHGSTTFKVAKQIFSPLYPMNCQVEELANFDATRAATREHRTVQIDEETKQNKLDLIRSEIGNTYKYNLYTFNCKTWANIVAPEAIT